MIMTLVFTSHKQNHQHRDLMLLTPAQVHATCVTILGIIISILQMKWTSRDIKSPAKNIEWKSKTITLCLWGSKAHALISASSATQQFHGT